MSQETSKQKLRRLLGRLTIDEAKKRELDRHIEEASEEEADQLVAFIEEAEETEPGAIERGIDWINKNGFPDGE